MPVSARELARDATACVAAGARALHIHPRNAEGDERLEAEVVDDVVSVVRAAAGVPVGVSTGAWIECDVERRIALISAWREPDYASVNVSEDGAADVMKALLAAGIGIEAGVWTVADVKCLATIGLGRQLMRVMVEPVDVSARDAVSMVASIHDELDRCGIEARRLQHGDGESTWVMLEDAVARRIDTRIGLEDTFFEPDGQLTDGNAALVRHAVALGAGCRTMSGCCRSEIPSACVSESGP